jgi:hypothetical protein
MRELELNLDAKSGFPAKNDGLPIQDSDLSVQSNGLSVVFIFL